MCDTLVGSKDSANDTVKEGELRTKLYVNELINGERGLTITSSDLSGTVVPYSRKCVGKVRDIYETDDYMIMVSTDRQSAFDRQLSAIPFKGKVLNLTSKWWFDATRALVPNHVVATPHPNVTICRKCSVFPVEFVMRGYLTGSTNTSIWTHYKNGVRQYCGHRLRNGLEKNAKLECPLLTPTTKDAMHDEPLSLGEVVSSGRMTARDASMCAKYAHALFDFSVAEAARRGLILVDTKYEFGTDASGDILLVDEVQTPDSSRYWVATSYEERFSRGEEPENIDKEFLRRWYADQCDPYKDEVLPEAPTELVNELSRRYILLYEVITGQTFDFTAPTLSVTEAVKLFMDSTKEGDGVSHA